MKYGRSAIAGNWVRPNISTGVIPWNFASGISVPWTNRDRFASTRMRSFSYVRTNASTRRLSGCRS